VPYNPRKAETFRVWAVPRSLATTWGITFVFFSSRYLDVSVPWVSALASDRPSACRVAPFGNLRINACLQLPAAYRSLPRPSSPVGAKASAACPSVVPSLLQRAYVQLLEASQRYSHARVKPHHPLFRRPRKFPLGRLAQRSHAGIFCCNYRS
jgi:hypothetical protein